MDRISIFIGFFFLSYLSSAQSYNWLLNGEGRQEVTSGNIIEPRGSGNRYHQGMDISRWDEQDIVNVSHRLRVYSTEYGIGFSIGGSRSTIILGSKAYLHLYNSQVRHTINPQAPNWDTVTVGEYIGNIDVFLGSASAAHLHYQLSSENLPNAFVQERISGINI